MIIKEEPKLIYKVFDIDIVDELVIEENIALEGKEFDDFIDTMKTLFTQNGFKKISESDSPNKGSKSKYYTFIKVVNNKIFKALVRVRISDHEVPDRIIDGELMSHDKHMIQLMKQRAKQTAKSYGQTRGYKSKYLDIILDGVHYFSYEDALDTIKKYLLHCN